MSKQYVVVTTVQTFRHRYVIPVDKLQARNPNNTVDPAWALDCVTCEEVKEFSQLHLGEQILDSKVASEEEVLELFDSDNGYLKGWDLDYKLEWINDCWEGSQESYHSYLSRRFSETKESNSVL
jgi:hypothetical protein